MRFHKVTEISATEGTTILSSAWISLNPYAVIHLFDQWFDIRQMTDGEVKNFTEDFMRKIAGEVQAGRAKPH